MKRGIVGIMLLLGAAQGTAASVNYLNKVFHHRGRLSDKIAFYFTHEPLCNQLPDARERTDMQWRTLKFFLPMTMVEADKCRQMVKQLNESENQFYSIHLEPAQTPVKGVAITITYDTTKRGFEYETFTSIKKEPGIVFRWYHKDVLQDLIKRTDALHHHASNKKANIVIDNGHGGEDAGAIGCFRVKEKDINLLVGLKLAQLLRKHGHSVSLTRSADRFISLGDRTTFANTVSKADLFVSVHSNSEPSAATSGIETFCPPQFPVTPGHTWELNDDALAIAQSVDAHRYKQSHMLADYVQHHTLACARTQQNQVIDRKVKTAISQVLLGTEMPAALIEIGFLSNASEAQLLNSETYQTIIAQGICNGIIAYINDCQTA